MDDDDVISPPPHGEGCECHTCGIPVGCTRLRLMKAFNPKGESVGLVAMDIWAAGHEYTDVPHMTITFDVHECMSHMHTFAAATEQLILSTVPDPSGLDDDDDIPFPS